MIPVPRDLARRFRAVAAKCQAGRPKGPAPPVACRAGGGLLSLSARVGDVALGVTAAATDDCDDAQSVPMAVLEDAAGSCVGAGAVELHRRAGRKAQAVWTDRGVPRQLAFAAGRAIDPPDVPAEMSPASPELLAARYALHRVQVRGRGGEVVGTDGRAALIAGGFEFPFAADLLVPAVPVFGVKDLAAQPDVRVGITAGRLVVAAGPWTVWLTADPAGRYPDVAAVIPKAARSVVGVDDRDAAVVLDALAALPAGDDPSVTVDLDGTGVVRAKGAAGVVEVRLSRSAAAGPPVRVALDRAVFRRALALGCRTVRLADDTKPAVFEGAGRTLVAVPLDPSAVVMPDPDVRPVLSDPAEPHPRTGGPR